MLKEEEQGKEKSNKSQSNSNNEKKKPSFLSTLDFKIIRKDSKNINSDNYLDYLNKWFKYVLKDLDEFEEYYGESDFFIINPSIDEIMDILDNLREWMIYIRNCINLCPEKIFKHPDNELIDRLVNLLRQFHGILVNRLDDLFVSFQRKFERSFIEKKSESIFDFIIENNETTMQLAILWIYTPITKEEILKILKNLIEGLIKIDFNLVSLNEITLNQFKRSMLTDLLIELKINQALDRITQAEQFLDEERWDTAVHEIRRAFEIVVTSIVRRVQGNSYWKAPTKDGLHILHEKGIITDDFFLNQLKARDVGIYGFLSIKGTHPDGESTENLADSDLEAMYCIVIASNAMEFLLKSFKNSEYYSSD